MIAQKRKKRLRMLFPVYGRESADMRAGVVGNRAPYPAAAIVNADELHLRS